jgi:hypothetical protein
MDICKRCGIARAQLSGHSDDGSPMKGETMRATLQPSDNFWLDHGHVNIFYLRELIEFFFTLLAPNPRKLITPEGGADEVRRAIVNPDIPGLYLRCGLVGTAQITRPD